MHNVKLQKWIGVKWKDIEEQNSLRQTCIYLTDAKSQVLEYSTGAWQIVVWLLLWWRSSVYDVPLFLLRFWHHDCNVHIVKATKSVSYPWVYIWGRGYRLWDCGGCGCRLGAPVYYSNCLCKLKRNEVQKWVVQWGNKLTKRVFLKKKRDMGMLEPKKSSWSEWIVGDWLD